MTDDASLFHFSEVGIVEFHEWFPMVSLKMDFWILLLYSPLKTNSLPLKIGLNAPKGKVLVFQRNPFSGANLLFVSGRGWLGWFGDDMFWNLTRDILKLQDQLTPGKDHNSEGRSRVDEDGSTLKL